MKKRHLFYIFFVFIFFYILLVVPLNGDSFDYRFIVDTDMALDDFRALLLLFNQNLDNIHLIVTSDGAVSPEFGAQQARKLLLLLKKSNTKVAMGRDLHLKPPPWRSWSEKILAWDNHLIHEENQNSLPAAQAIIHEITLTKKTFIYICLGPLTNLADALKKGPSIKKNISQVVYFGNSPKNKNPSWNTARDLKAAEYVFNSELRIFTFNHPQSEEIKFTQQFLEKIKTLDTPAAKLMVKLHSHSIIKELLIKNHFSIWDEIPVLYLENPSIIQFKQLNKNIYQITNVKLPKIQNLYLDILSQTANTLIMEREVVVLNSFPKNPSSYKEDVKPLVKTIINKHGIEEWKACVLTNELHRHLGIYSLVGVKMGIRARELLKAPLDNLSVISNAGNRPPLSCLNDGLQVSTGASLGRGTIQISETAAQPAAIFIYKNKKLTLKIKTEIVQQIKKDIQKAINKYGSLTPEYFSYIRRLSIRYWEELDRTKIFVHNYQDL